mgnify:CR=1 FL=1
MLVERSGQVVSKEELVSAYPGRAWLSRTAASRIRSLHYGACWRWSLAEIPGSRRFARGAAIVSSGPTMRPRPRKPPTPRRTTGSRSAHETAKLPGSSELTGDDQGRADSLRARPIRAIAPHRRTRGPSRDAGPDGTAYADRRKDKLRLSPESRNRQDGLHRRWRWTGCRNRASICCADAAPRGSAPMRPFCL